ncbi:MAG: polysaccharide pyruvyl transferase family protein [Verrucomicrobia bacterium]|nr:polysaccharide pyruvyl transferase family protein [Verrucomicrobiota bacterium]
MKKVLVLFFDSMNNYGVGMMGINSMFHLRRIMKHDVNFYADLSEKFEIGAFLDEVFESNFPLERCPRLIPTSFSNKIKRLLLSSHNILDYDGIIFLGGDNLSEYYSCRLMWRSLMRYASWSFFRPMFLLGQSIGPFNYWKNRLIFRYLMRRCHIFARDAWTVNYLAAEFKLRKNVHPSADLAFLDLPRQHEMPLWIELSERYGLQKDKYITIVVSALHDQYVQDRQIYLLRWKDIITSLAKHPPLADKKICLLAHTFGRSQGDEGSLIREVSGALDDALKAKLICITDKIFPTRARLVLGNGLLTVTGRMHAAISTFQMGKPAIALAYSKKYEGVIGQNLKRSDLVIDARRPQAWMDGAICRQVMERVDYVLARHCDLTREIEQIIPEQKRLATAALERIARTMQGH